LARRLGRLRPLILLRAFYARCLTQFGKVCVWAHRPYQAFEQRGFLTRRRRNLCTQVQGGDNARNIPPCAASQPPSSSLNLISNIEQTEFYTVCTQTYSQDQEQQQRLGYLSPTHFTLGEDIDRFVYINIY
jgi:hypothetical protein